MRCYRSVLAVGAICCAGCTYSYEPLHLTVLRRFSDEAVPGATVTSNYQHGVYPFNTLASKPEIDYDVTNEKGEAVIQVAHSQSVSIIVKKGAAYFRFYASKDKLRTGGILHDAPPVNDLAVMLVLKPRDSHPPK